MLTLRSSPHAAVSKGEATMIGSMLRNAAFVTRDFGGSSA
jgi:hypothetical protein